MTALNFLFEPQRVCIAMDTLSVEPEQKRPHLFCSKIFLLPHLGGVMIGTGAVPIITDWFIEIQSKAVVRDLLHFDQYAPDLLKVIWARNTPPPGITATIYHFGYSRELGEFRAFAYRSTNEFASEPVPYGWGVKPQIAAEQPTQTSDFVEVISRQREQDRERPIAEQVGIGGEVHFLHMTPDAFQLVNLHRFEDYDDQYAEMVRNLGAPPGADPSSADPGSQQTPESINMNARST